MAFLPCYVYVKIGETSQQIENAPRSMHAIISLILRTYFNMGVQTLQIKLFDNNKMFMNIHDFSWSTHVVISLLFHGDVKCSCYWSGPIACLTHL